MVCQGNSLPSYVKTSTLRGLGLQRREDSERVAPSFVGFGRLIENEFLLGGKQGHGRRYTFYMVFRLCQGLFWMLFCFAACRCRFRQSRLAREGARTLCICDDTAVMSELTEILETSQRAPQFFLGKIDGDKPSLVTASKSLVIMQDERVFVSLTYEPIEPMKMMDLVRAHEAGAMVLFAGTTRNNFAGNSNQYWR